LGLNVDNENNEEDWKTFLDEVGNWTQAGDCVDCIVAMLGLAS